LKTLINAMRRPTDSTEQLIHSILMGGATVGFTAILWQQVRPAFAEIGRAGEFTLILAIVAAASIGMAVTLWFKVSAEWRQIVADQAKNDAAGCNIVGQKEARNLARYDEAMTRAKLSRRTAKEIRAMAR
jgi:Flp pilus assembly pilin Flp